MVKINLTNASGAITIDADSIVDPNKAIKTQTSRTIEPEKLEYALYSTGTGADGAITVSSNASINTTNLISGRTCVDGGDAVNYSVTALTSTTATIESAPSSGCLSVGDEVLLINLRGNYAAMNNTGNFETLTVSSIASNIVTFTTAKTKYYGDGTSDDTNVGVGTGAQAVMLQRVPNYTTVTVNTSINFYPDAWVSPTGVANNGAGEGGVMFFRATGAVAINGTIHANSKGYIGGPGGAINVTESGDGGESICGAGGVGGTGAGNDGAAGSGANTGLGGTGYCGGGGGAGQGSTSVGIGSTTSGGSGGGGGGLGGGGGAGGYGAAGAGAGRNYGGVFGSVGGTNASGNGGTGTGTNNRGGGGGGGGSYGDAALTDLFFGSPGGGGGSYGANGSTGGTGGGGGGIVYIAANSVTVSGALQSNAGASTAAVCGTAGQYGGGGGGGTGGSIKVVGNTINLGSSLVTATGTNNSNGCENGGAFTYSGGGTVGRIATCANGSISGTSSQRTP